MHESRHGSRSRHGPAAGVTEPPVLPLPFRLPLSSHTSALRCCPRAVPSPRVTQHMRPPSPASGVCAERPGAHLPVTRDSPQAQLLRRAAQPPGLDGHKAPAPRVGAAAAFSGMSGSLWCGWAALERQALEQEWLRNASENAWKTLEEPNTDPSTASGLRTESRGRRAPAGSCGTGV